MKKSVKFIETEWRGRRLRFLALKDARKNSPGDKQGLWIHFQGQTWFWSRAAPGASDNSEKARGGAAPSGLILSPMPGQIQAISVQKGEKIKKGQALLVMSAMKMEYAFQAEASGLVREICCQEGQQAEARQILMRIDYD